MPARLTGKMCIRDRIDVDPKRVMSTMPVSQRQMVEIAKAVSFNSKIIVFDAVSYTHLFGFSMQMKDGRKFTCVGDEPYNEANYDFVKDSDWLLHEAFCL